MTDIPALTKLSEIPPDSPEFQELDIPSDRHARAELLSLSLRNGNVGLSERLVKLDGFNYAPSANMFAAMLGNHEGCMELVLRELKEMYIPTDDSINASFVRMVDLAVKEKKSNSLRAIVKAEWLSEFGMANSVLTKSLFSGDVNSEAHRECVRLILDRQTKEETKGCLVKAAKRGDSFFLVDALKKLADASVKRLNLMPVVIAAAEANHGREVAVLLDEMERPDLEKVLLSTLETASPSSFKVVWDRMPAEKKKEISGFLKPDGFAADFAAVVEKCLLEVKSLPDGNRKVSPKGL